MDMKELSQEAFDRLREMFDKGESIEITGFCYRLDSLNVLPKMQGDPAGRTYNVRADMTCMGKAPPRVTSLSNHNRADLVVLTERWGVVPPGLYRCYILDNIGVGFVRDDHGNEWVCRAGSSGMKLPAVKRPSR